MPKAPDLSLEVLLQELELPSDKELWAEFENADHTFDYDIGAPVGNIQVEQLERLSSFFKKKGKDDKESTQIWEFLFSAEDGGTGASRIEGLLPVLGQLISTFDKAVSSDRHSAL